MMTQRHFNRVFAAALITSIYGLFPVNSGLAATGDGPLNVDQLRASAEGGSAEAQQRLGDLYIDGHGVLANYSLAATWYNRAAVQGDPVAQFKIGYLTGHGLGVPVNPAKAMEWYGFAAEQGHLPSQVKFGIMSRTLDPRGTAKAYRMLGRAAESGSHRALSLLQTATLHGNSTARQVFRALPDTAKKPPQISPSNLGDEAKKGFAAYRKQKFKTARAIFKNLAATNQAAGWFGLGLLHRSGNGAPKDLDRAHRYFAMAAEAGLASAQVGLAELYLTPDFIERDPNIATMWYAKAAAAGDPLALHMSGLLSLIGYGAWPDSAIVEERLRRAVKRHVAGAGNTLAVSHLARQFIDSDDDEATVFRVSATPAYLYAGPPFSAIVAVVPAADDQPSPVGRTALDELRAAAKRGGVDAQWNLAQVYRGGHGVPQNQIESHKFLSLAIDGEHPLAASGQRVLASNMSQRQILHANWSIAQTMKPRIAAPPDLENADDLSPAEARKLGIRYQFGNGVAKNFDEAAKWYLKAADNGDRMAQGNLAYMYRTGRGVPQKYELAAQWYRKAADQGSRRSQRNLGILHQFGRGVPQDDSEAVRWYRKAADGGDAKAQANLAFMLKIGRGVEKSDKQAAAYYRKAAEQGSARGQRDLGVFYEKGRGVEQDEYLAAEWYLKAANQGDAKAQANLGGLYKSGRGVSKDYEESASWYRKAADQGLARAQTVIGLMYRDGVGVDSDDGHAAFWFAKAIKQRRRDAQKFLDELIMDERGATDALKDLNGYYLSVARLGDSRAMNSLGLMYQFGKGVEKNPSEAEQWYRKAIKKGNADAKQNLESLIKLKK